MGIQPPRRVPYASSSTLAPDSRFDEMSQKVDELKSKLEDQQSQHQQTLNQLTAQMTVQNQQFIEIVTSLQAQLAKKQRSGKKRMTPPEDEEHSASDSEFE